MPEGIAANIEGRCHQGQKQDFFGGEATFQAGTKKGRQPKAEGNANQDPATQRSRSLHCQDEKSCGHKASAGQGKRS
jgi:hypothetical protein